MNFTEPESSTSITRRLPEDNIIITSVRLRGRIPSTPRSYPVKILISTLSLLLLIASQESVAQVEIVIDVSDQEAQGVLESYSPDELQYAESSWESNGRIRVAKIDTEALKQTGYQVQFTPFPDVEPIVMTSLGMGGDNGRTWTGERVNHRFDGLPERTQMIEMIKNDPQLTQNGASPADDHTVSEVLKFLDGLNVVQLKVVQYSMDPVTRDYLLDPKTPHAELYLINRETNQAQSVSQFESAYKKQQKSVGITDPCELTPVKLPRGSMRQASAPPPPPPPPLPGEIQRQTDSGGGRSSFSSAGGDAALSASSECVQQRHVLDRIENLSQDAEMDSHLKHYGITDGHKYRRAAPLPHDVLLVDSVSGQIKDKSDQGDNAPDLEIHGYSIRPLVRHPEYVIVSEFDKTRRIPIMMGTHDDSGWKYPERPETDEDRRIEKLRNDKAAHLTATNNRIAARNNNAGGSK